MSLVPDSDCLGIQFQAKVFHFTEEGRIPSEPIGHSLPFRIAAHIVAIRLVWSIHFLAIRIITMVVIVPQVIALAPGEPLSG